MTDQEKTDSRSNELDLVANRLCEVIGEASLKGFKVALWLDTYLDLVDTETGERTPIWTLPKVEDV